MAVSSPLMPCPSGTVSSAFSPYSDSPTSPSHTHSHFNTHSSASTDSTGHLQPQPQRSPGLSSSSDAEGPSPILSSNGTEFDESAADEHVSGRFGKRNSSERAPIKVETKDESGNDFRPSSSEDDHPSSVIHAPKGFEPFPQTNRSPPVFGRSTPTPSQRSDVTVISPQDEDDTRNFGPLSPGPPPISTDIPPMREKFMTPQAQTRQEAEALERDRVTRSKTKSLEDIPESLDNEADYRQDTGVHAAEYFRRASDEVAALRVALTECWTLCNTLSGLSHVHRERAFRQSSKSDGREQAWKSCWALCQRLYNTWDEDHPSPVALTLNLCREFCQALFEVRQRENDVADSVLRVSFELNNHLYNTHDRALPEAFRERTLDFYITLCHRLMKQRNIMGEETDALLRACWSLAEMLFSLRQNKREGKPADEELLGSAVQACWELCDLFREGWTQVRPDRGTPRPSQATFTQVFQQARQAEAVTVRLNDDDDYDDDVGRQNPETPTTIFEDTTNSPDEATVPNIIVLGPEAQDHYSQQWSSASSSLSGYSGDNTADSTSTIAATVEDPRLTCLKLLLVQAATNLGYTRDTSLTSFAKSLPSSSFGTAPWQAKLLENYKRLISSDAAFRRIGPVQRASAQDIATSVSWMVRTGQYTWLDDLYRWVFGFHVDEAHSRVGTVIQC